MTTTRAGLARGAAAARLTALATALLLTATACGGSGGSGGSGGGSSSSSGAAGGSTSAAVKTDAALHAKLPQAVQDAGTISIGTEALYPPYEYLGGDGSTIIGLDPELMDAVTQRLGIEYTLTNTAFDGLLPALEAGRFTAVWAAVSDTKAREAKYDFVDYFQAGQAIVVKAGNPEKIQDVEDLCGKKVSVLTSSAQEALLQRFNTDQCASSPIAVTSLPTDQDALLQVQSGRAQATFTQEPVGRYNASKIAGGHAFEVANDETLYPNPLGVVVKKGDVQLRDALQAALQSLIDDGTYGKILAARKLSSGAVEKATTNAGTS